MVAVSAKSPPSTSSELAFPKLTDAELAAFEAMACKQRYADGETVFRAGQADLDLFVVKSGAIDILNPTDAGRLVVTHEPGEFAGDIDLLTRRPVIVNAVARGETELLRVANKQIHDVLNAIPRLGEKLITAITVRRELLQRGGR
jgi:thioredoxin reductase (NADPH)